MRAEIRIDNFLLKVDIRDLLLNIWKVCDDSNVDSIHNNIVNNMSYIRETWHYDYDLRFSQVLIHLGYLPNSIGFWFYLEEDEILKKQGYKPREYTFWGSVYDKDGQLLKETRYSLVKDLERSHIEKIIFGGFVREGTEIYDIMVYELKLKSRREKLLKIGSYGS